jgi:uncharacterized protein (TIGR03083 family)
VGWLSHRRYQFEFRRETGLLGELVVGCDPDLAVPTCPGWTVRDLVRHVGTGHRWATTIVADQLTGPAPYEPAEPPDAQDGWPDWLAEGANGLMEAIRAVGPDQAVWTWQAEQRAGFWLRRMLHDELVHRFDVEIATDGKPGEVPADLAADGVSDLLETAATLSAPNTFRHSGFGELRGTGELLAFRATDAELTGAELTGAELTDGGAGRWLVERTPEGVRWRDSSAPAGVVVRGPARELLLVLNRRLDPGVMAVEGDGDLLAHWLAHSAF